jgi:hypothetical protein
MARGTSTTTEEEVEAKASLPINHPKAGYVAPDLSAIDNREPPNEEETQSRRKPTREENIKAREEAAKAVAESEDAAVKEEQEAAEEAAKEAEKEKAKEKAPA